MTFYTVLANLRHTSTKNGGKQIKNIIKVSCGLSLLL